MQARHIARETADVEAVAREEKIEGARHRLGFEVAVE